MSPPPPTYLTAAAAASRLGTDERRVRAWCAAGYLPGAGRFGRAWYIPEAALAAFQRPPRGNPAWTGKKRRKRTHKAKRA